MQKRLYSLLGNWDGGWSECGRGDYLILAVVGIAIVTIGVALTFTSAA